MSAPHQCYSLLMILTSWNVGYEYLCERNGENLNMAVPDLPRYGHITLTWNIPPLVLGTPPLKNYESSLQQEHLIGDEVKIPFPSQKATLPTQDKVRKISKSSVRFDLWCGIN